MDAIEQWKQLIRQANSAFAHDHFQLAAALYKQAAGVMTDAWPYYVENQKLLPQQQWQDSVVLMVICFSVSVQNLAETYARQQRWRRCLSVLRKTQQVLQRLTQQLPGSHPASVAILRESCHIRHAFCRYSQQPFPNTLNIAATSMPRWLH